MALQDETTPKILKVAAALLGRLAGGSVSEIPGLQSICEEVPGCR